MLILIFIATRPFDRVGGFLLVKRGEKMLRKTKAAVFFAIGTICCSTMAIADTFPVDQDGYKQIRIAPGVSRADNYLELLAPFMVEFPDMEERRAQIRLTMKQIEGGIGFNLIHDGFADDSVSGEQFKGVMIINSHGWELIEIHQRWICARGKRSDMGICP